MWPFRSSVSNDKIFVRFTKESYVYNILDNDYNDVNKTGISYAVCVIRVRPDGKESVKKRLYFDKEEDARVVYDIFLKSNGSKTLKEVIEESEIKIKM
jgi:predicted RNA-binding protein (virulence factor B family)